MLDPTELFSLAPHVEPPELDQHTDDRPTLLVTLGSYGDAGQTQALIDEHLFERLANHKVGTFDVDQLFDYTGHRPPIARAADAGRPGRVGAREFPGGRLAIQHPADGERLCRDAGAAS